MAGGITLAPLKVEIKVPINDFKKAMGYVGKVGEDAANGVSKNFSGIASSLSNGLSKVAGFVSTAISKPLLIAGTACAKLGTDFEDAVAKVSTISNESEVPISTLRTQILKLSNDTGIASKDIANDVYDAISSGQKTGDAVNFVRESTKLAKAGFADSSDALDLLTTVMNGYKMSAEDVTKVSDNLITTQNLGKVTVGELSESMGRIIKTADQSNVSFEQVSTGYALMTSNGIKSAETTTYMSSMFTELSKSGTNANKAVKAASGKTFPELMKKGKSLGDVLNIMDGYAKKNGKSLTDMFSSAEGGKAALVLAGAEGKDFNKILEDMNHSSGATNEAFKKVSNTSGEKMKKAFNELKNAGVEMGGALAPHIINLSKFISNLAKSFTGLSPATQNSIIKMGALGIALAPVLKIASSGIGIIGKLSGILGGGGAVAGVGGGLASGLGSALVACAPFAVGLGAVALAGYGVHKAMTQKAIPSVDLLGDSVVATGSKFDKNGDLIQGSMNKTVTKISEGTKKSVDEYIKMDKDIGTTLQGIYVKSEKISEETAKIIVEKYQGLGDKVTDAINDKKGNELEAVKSMLDGVKDLDEQSKAEIMQNTEKFYSEKESKVKANALAVQTIMGNASKQNRELTKEEYEHIAILQQTMGKEAIANISATEEEKNSILANMEANRNSMSAEMMGENIRQLNEARNKDVDSAKKAYADTIKEANHAKDDLGTISQEQYNAIIASAEKTKEESIKKADGLRQGALDKMQELNKDLFGKVSTSTGDIKSMWGDLKEWWDSWSPSSKEFKATVVVEKRADLTKEDIDAAKATDGSNYNGLPNVPYDGYISRLHKGERVLTAEENKVYSKDTNNNNLVVNFNEPVASPIENVRRFKNAMQDASLAY